MSAADCVGNGVAVVIDGGGSVDNHIRRTILVHRSDSTREETRRIVDVINPHRYRMAGATRARGSDDLNSVTRLVFVIGAANQGDYTAGRIDSK